MTVLETKLMELACSFFSKFHHPTRKDRVRETASRMLPSLLNLKDCGVEDKVRVAIMYAEELENQLEKKYKK